MDRFYITTAIDYVNASPHLGHALEKTQADVLARYQRSLGKDVYFLTGADEHGIKIVRSAQESKKDIKKPKKGDDDLLLAMAESDSWELFTSMINNMQSGIEVRCKELVGKARTWEEVSKIYFARDVSIDSMQSMLNVVNLRKQAKDAQESTGE